MFTKILLILAYGFLLVTHCFAENLTIAAASDMTYCVPELVKEFQTDNPKSEVKTLFGSSGNLFAQIKNGAPFDVYMSADMQYPTELANVGAADKSSLMPYARGHLMLWTANAAINLDKGLQGLSQSSIKRIAIANPETAPYGRAARAALQQAKLWDDITPLLVFGDNISQTLQYAETGNADVAIVSRSLVLSPKMVGKGHAQAIPETAYPPLNQGLVITNKGSGNLLAVKFAKFMQSDKAKTILERFGFSIPNKPSN
ncbi:MAG: molybdate ABC transporter substrate-binding protein [Gallionellaceae bacterium]